MTTSCIPLDFVQVPVIKNMFEAFSKDMEGSENSSHPLNLTDCVDEVALSYISKRQAYDKKDDIIPLSASIPQTEKLLFLPASDEPIPNTIREKLKRILEEEEEYISDAICVSWLSTKKIYQMDADFAKELLITDEIKLYADIVKNIPFKTFYIDTTNVDFFNKTLGVFVHLNFSYSKQDYLQYDLYMTEVREPIMDFKTGRLFYDRIMRHSWQNDDDIRKDSNGTQYIVRSNDFKKYTLHAIDDANPDFEDEDIYAIKLGTFVLNFTTYLASKAPDIQETPESKKTYRPFDKPNFKYGQVQTFKAGVRYGNKIRFLQKLEKLSSEEPCFRVGKAGSPKRPHIRGAHWTHVWCGHKEQQHLEIRWIEPCYVNGTHKTIDATINELTTKIAHMWSGEQMIHEYLDAMNIKHQMQYYVPQIGKRYDCCAEVSGCKLFIEYDGEQHFYPVDHFGGEDKFQKQRQADKEKDVWCEDHGHPLLRIRYTDKPMIATLLSSALKDPDRYLRNHSHHGKEYYILEENTPSIPENSPSADDDLESDILEV